MAFYDENEDKDQEGLVQGQQAGVATGQGSSVIGASGGPSASGDQQAAGNAQGAPEGSSSPTTFAGIQDYVNANKAQTAKLAGDVGSMVTGQGNEARSQLQTGQQTFNQDVDKNTVKLDERVFNTAQQDPNAVSQNQQDLTTFQGMRDAEYKGPQTLEEQPYFQDINKSFNQAQQSSEKTQTDAGQRELLSNLQFKQRGKVNQGALDFNSALLQGDLDARSILDSARNSNADLGSILEKAKVDAIAKAKAAGDTTAATRKAIEEKFSGPNGVQGLLEQDINKRVADAVAKSKTDNASVMEALKANAVLNDQQLKTMGLSREQYNALKGDIALYNNTWKKNMYQDLSGYATQQSPEAAINAQNLASADDYARYQALNALMGTNNGLLKDPSQAGTADLTNMSFDLAGAQGNVQGSINVARTADAQAKAEAEAAARRQAETDARNAETNATVTGAAVGFAVDGPVGAVTGGVIGNVVCFLKNTSIMMFDGSYKMVQDLKLGDITAVGGRVLGKGEAYSEQIVGYKGIFTSPNHAIFDGSQWKRAKDLNGAMLYNLDIPAIVYPIVNEKHVLITTNDVVYADLIEHDDSVGMSDAEKLSILNKLQYVEQTKELEKELKWKSQSSKINTIQN